MKKIYISTLLTFFALSIFGQAPTNGLVAHYKMDGNANDETGVNNGIQQGGVNFTTATDRFGLVGKAAGFDGIDDYITANFPSQNTVIGQFSISSWVYINDFYNQSWFPILEKPTASNEGSFHLSYENSSPNLICGVLGVSGSNTFSHRLYKGQWYNIIITYNGSSKKIFINGILITNLPNSGSVTLTNTPLNIGKDSPGLVEYSNGKLDDIRIYNRALTDTEVQQLYQAEAPPIDITTGLVAHYKMDGNAQDASGNGNHGTQQGGVNFLTATDRFGLAGEAAGFDGLDDFITSQNNINISGNSNRTISLWFKNEDKAFNGSVNLVSWGSKNNNGNYCGLKIKDSGLLQFDSNSSQNDISSGIIFISKNDWNHFAFTFENGEGKLFFNGILLTSKSIALNTLNSLLKIGWDNTFNTYPGLKPYGLIDEVRIYNRALSVSEIEALHKTDIPPINKGMIVHYKMNNNLNDVSGNNNHGTQQGGLDFTTGIDRFGKLESVASFDGIDDYITINKNLNLSHTFSIHFWVKINQVYPNVGFSVFSKQCSFEIAINSDKTIRYAPYYTLWSNPTQNIELDKWIAIDLVFNGSQIKVFKNGEQTYRVYDATNINQNNSNNISIGKVISETGCFFSGGQSLTYFKGSLDDIRIYNRALSDAEVANLYKLESEGIVEIKQTATLKVNPITVPVGNNKFLEGAEFSANSTVTINITRDVPGLPITPIIAITDNQGKFGGVQLPNNDLGASFRVVATDANGNKATISYNTSDNLNYVQLTYPFKGSIIQANASGGNTLTLKWNDKVNLTNSISSGGSNRTVTYVINYKAFNDVNWSADIIKTKTLPFGNNANITDNLTLPGTGTYSIRIKHQNVAELWNVTGNITIQAGDNIQVSYYNNRFVSSNAIKGIVADGVSRMQINCVLPVSSLTIKRVIVTLQDPISNKTTKEILGILEDGRNKTESEVEADAYNPTFNLSTTFNNIQNRAWSMWYFAPTDFSDGAAFLSDKVHNVKLRFEVVYDQNGTEVSEIKNHDIQIARPPLMMLGGIGLPASDTWEKFNSYMTNFGGLYMYPLEQGLVNYNPGGDANGSSSFINNALNILEGNETYGKKSYKTVRKIMTDLGFVCGRVDVLTHGMGSSVVHASMLHNGGSSFFNNSDTYKKGYANKFISLNAEKNGTPLIDLVEALLKEANKNPITADDLNSAIDFVKEYNIATSEVRKTMKDAIKTGVSIKGKALSYLTTRYLIYYTLANLELPFVGHLVKRIPRTKPQPITIPKRDEFLNELGSIEELNVWFEYLPTAFSSISVNNLGEKFDELTKLPDLSRLNILTKAKNALLSSADYGGAYLGYYLKSDSLVVSDAANELRNNEIDIYNRTLLTPVPLPTSGIHYLVGDLVGGNQENLLSATDWLIEKNEYVERYSKMLDAVSGVFEKIDELSDYKYLVNKTQYQSMRDELKARNGTNEDKTRLYSKWRDENRVPFLNDQSKIKDIQDILKLLEIPKLVFNYVKTGAEALSFVFNSDGIATTASQSATNTIQGLNASNVTRFPASFNSSDPFEGITKYNYFSMPSNFNVYSRIRELLNTSINSNLFIKTIAQPFYGPSGFNPFGPSTSSLSISDSKKSAGIKLNSLNTNALFIKNLADTSVVKIIKPFANSSLSVGSKMEVQVNLKDTTNFSQLELSFQGQKYYQVEKTKNSVFYINIEPSEETELLQVTAKYRLGVDSSLHISDRLRVTPLNTEAIQKIIPLQEIIYVKKGQLFSQSCFLTYQSYETYMTADPRFVFAFTNSGIISFDNTTGFFKALQIGTTEVTGTYKNINFNFVVIVEDLPLSIVPVTIYNNACLGRNINVSLNKNGFTDTNTNYFIELSNGTGSFANSTMLFSGKNVQNQTVTLPNNISEGNNYQIRVRTDIPSYSSTENIVMSLHEGGMLKSVKSGYWIDPSTWSCGEVPTSQSNVLLKTPHKIELLPNQTGKAKSITTESGSILELNNSSIIEIKN